VSEKKVKTIREEEYNPGEHRAELARVLAKIAGRKVTGKVEIDLSQGSPATLKTREVVKEAE
jgi:hypothetical protein